MASREVDRIPLARASGFPGSVPATRAVSPAVGRDHQPVANAGSRGMGCPSP